MPDIFIYLLKANIILSLLYLIYRFGLQRLTFYKVNRYVLGISVLFASFCPLIDFQTLFQSSNNHAVGNLASYALDWQAIMQQPGNQEIFTIWNLLQIVFWAGVIVMGLRLLFQFVSLAKIYLLSEKKALNGEIVSIITGEKTPFSFFNAIFINPLLHESEETTTILQHEKVHVSELHSLDILLGELMLIFYWFNPMAWLMRNAIRENLEFKTDQEVLRAGFQAKTYQYNLLKSMTRVQKNSLANNFNLSHLKKRIMMMNKEKSSKKSIVRYFVFLPMVLLIAVITSSSRPQDLYEYQGPQRIDTSGEGNLPSTFPSDFKGIYLVDGKIVSTDKLKDIAPSDIKSIKVLKGEAAVKAFGDKGENGVIKIFLKKDNVQSNKKEVTVDEKPQPLYIIDGKSVSKDVLDQLNPDKIASIDVLKDESAVKKYGEKGENGVVEITLKTESN